MDVRMIDYWHVEQALADYGWIKATHDGKGIEKRSISGKCVCGVIKMWCIFLKNETMDSFYEFDYDEIDSIQISNSRIRIYLKGNEGMDFEI